jgi:hypothetical protein
MEEEKKENYGCGKNIRVHPRRLKTLLLEGEEEKCFFLI